MVVVGVDGSADSCATLAHAPGTGPASGAVGL